MVINKHIFRQADFSEISIKNVTDSLLDGAIVVAVIIAFFLIDLKATFIPLRKGSWRKKALLFMRQATSSSLKKGWPFQNGPTVPGKSALLSLVLHRDDWPRL